ncbi:MAG: DUF3267 domain-containing protein [Acetatifactor sp.]
MIFHKAGKYNGDESTLPQREHHPNAVPFKEPKSMLLLSIIANAGAFLMIVLMGIPVFLLGREYITRDNSIFLVLALWFPMLTIVPHEFLHALCFKKDVYYYTNFKQGMAFVVGTEDMSKLRFIMMSLCPNLVFGWLPYLIFLLFPNLVYVGAFGTICIGMGFGDYINVFNALTQMPKGAKTYLCGMHSFWYVD